MPKKVFTKDKKQKIDTNKYEGEESLPEPDIPEECYDPDTGLISEERIEIYLKNKKTIEKETIKEAFREVKKEDEDKGKEENDNNIKEEKETDEKEIVYKKPELKGNIAELTALWGEIFEIYSFNNPEYSIACFHLVMGMVLKKCRIDRDGTNTDPRISVLYIKPTFSGGSAGFDMVSLIAKKLNFHVNKITDASDAALIGSFEKDKDTDESIVKRGILDKSVSDLVYWGEASVIFQKNLPTHSMKTRNYLQAALNPIDSEESKLEKELKDGKIICEVQCSLLLVTFPPRELDDDILYSGAVQRFCFIPKALNIDGRMANIDEDIKRYEKKGVDIEGKVVRLITLLFGLKEHYGGGALFRMGNDATTRFKELEKELGEKYRKTDQRIQDHMGGILSSTVRKISAISMHAAAIRRSNIINKDDIEYAVSILEPQLEMIHEYLESRPEHFVSSKREEDELLKFMTLYDGKPKINKTEMLNEIGKCLKLSSWGAQNKRFLLWQKQGTIVKDQKGQFIVVYNEDTKEKSRKKN